LEKVRQILVAALNLHTWSGEAKVNNHSSMTVLLTIILTHTKVTVSRAAGFWFYLECLPTTKISLSLKTQRFRTWAEWRQKQSLRSEFRRKSCCPRKRRSLFHQVSHLQPMFENNSEVMH